MDVAHRWTARTALFVLGLGLIVGPSQGQAADGKEGAIPETDYPKVIEQQIKVLQDTLKALKEAKDKDEAKKMRAKARCTAVMLAAVAQDNLAGKDAPQRASLRDAALQVADLVKKEKVDDAVKQADDLKNVKVDAKAKTEKVKLFDAHIDLEELMTQFRLPKAGGQGWEKLFLNLATDKKKTIPTTSMNDALVHASYLTAVAGELTADHVPAKDKPEWVRLAQDMRKSAVELAEKVKAKDGKAAFAALSKLNASCSVCHDKFRANN